MKHPTKQKRLVAIFYAYCKMFCVTSATADEVSVWAAGNGLWPVPKRGDPEDEIEAWEKRFELAQQTEEATDTKP